MIEQALADRFHAVLADEPPLGFDPDDVVDRAVRMERRRAAVLGASTAAAAVVLGAVTVLQVVRTGDDPVAGLGSAPTTKPTETKPADPCATKPKPTEPPVTKTKPTGPTETKPSPPVTKTKPTETKPTGTKPTETKPTQTKPTETKPKPTETKPKPPPSCEKPKDETDVPFTGWEQAAALFKTAAPQVLAEHAPGKRFDSVGVKPFDDRRCVAGAYQVNGDGYSAVSIIVCHNQKTGLDLSPVSDGDYGPMVSDTIKPDGSHVRVYRFDGGTEAGGLAVVHHRIDGVVVQVDTAYKSVHGQQGPVLSQEQLTAVATDGRLTF